MHAAGECYIFHLSRHNGRALVLHRLHRPKDLLSVVQYGEVRGRYGNEPSMETLRALRLELDARAEARFVPTFLISVAVFLATYFIASVLIPDPIPMIDEVFLGVFIAAATYVFLTRRDWKSTAAVLQKRFLVDRVDRIVFTESTLVAKAERVLRECEVSNPGESDSVRLPMVEVDDEEIEEASQLIPLLASLFDTGALSRVERSLKKSGMIPARKRNDLDFPLFFLYHALKEGVGEKFTREVPLPVDSTSSPAARDP
jgi:hypothetical protein